MIMQYPLFACGQYHWQSFNSEIPNVPERTAVSMYGRVVVNPILQLGTAFCVKSLNGQAMISMSFGNLQVKWRLLQSIAQRVHNAPSGEPEPYNTISSSPEDPPPQIIEAILQSTSKLPDKSASPCSRFARWGTFTMLLRLQSMEMMSIC